MVVAVIVLPVGTAVVAGRISSSPVARVRRPVRALGPGGGGDATPIDAAPGRGASAATIVGPAVKPTRSKAVRSLGKPSSPATAPWVQRELSLRSDPDATTRPGANPDDADASALAAPDGTLQTSRGTGTPMPIPSLNVKGLGYGANGRRRLVPPDPNGAVGLTQFVQMVNVRWAVFDKATGSMDGMPHALSQLFAGAPNSLCHTHNDGDPVVVYDQIHDRWVLSQFALDFKHRRFAECIAVSTSSDATGTYSAYQFIYPRPYVFNDYPKFGVWPDTYFATFNQFHVSRNGAFSYAGEGAIAYEQDQMVLGLPAHQIYKNLNNMFGMLPADLDGANLPPANAPGIYAQMDPKAYGYPKDQLELWAFHVNWTSDTGSFTAIRSITTGDGLNVNAFNPFPCGTSTTDCVPQKGTKTKVDSIPDRLMFRLQFRHFGPGDNRLTFDQSVKAGAGRVGVRWYELKSKDALVTPSSWSVLHQGTYAPVGKTSRWMGSAALDKDGNLAVAFSESGPGMHPSIAYAGRLATDPGNALTQAERRGFTGTGSESGKYGRWGDYSDLTLDPVDDCTFWYTNQYYADVGQYAWQTRILSFKYPGCV